MASGSINLENRTKEADLLALWHYQQGSYPAASAGTPQFKPWWDSMPVSNSSFCKDTWMLVFSDKLPSSYKINKDLRGKKKKAIHFAIFSWKPNLFLPVATFPYFQTEERKHCPGQILHTNSSNILNFPYQISSSHTILQHLSLPLQPRQMWTLEYVRLQRMWSSKDLNHRII